MEILKGRFAFKDPVLAEMAETAHEIGAEMVLGLLPNPTGAGYFDTVSYGNQHMQFPIDPAVSAANGVPMGTVMEIENYTGPGTSNPPTTALVQPSSTTADNKLLGVLTGGQQTGVSLTVAVGKLATICVFGLVQVLCDATTTAGQNLIQSAATAGAAKTTGSAVTAGQGLGVALQAVTISSGTSLVWALIKPF